MCSPSSIKRTEASPLGALALSLALSVGIISLCFRSLRLYCNEVSRLVLEDFSCSGHGRSFHGNVYDQNGLLYDKVTVLESEKRAWEATPEAEAIREALNPWRKHDAGSKKSS